MKRKELIVLASVVFVCLVILVCMLSLVTSKDNTLDLSEIPINWDSNYTEDADDYAVQFEVENWDTYTPSPTEEFTTVTISNFDTKFSEIESFNTSHVTHRTNTDCTIAGLSEANAWAFISNNIFAQYPTSSYSANADKLKELKNTNTETITVKCWYWENPKDDMDMSKKTVTKTFAVNSKLADTFVHIFEDIYADETKPIINIADTGMGTWVLRGKNHNSSNTMSAHSLGVAIDINPSTGSFYINNQWYGNAYGQKAMPYSIWEQLPECHKKYHVLYDGCPIVEIFKAYGFYWGGDWKTGTDSMHLSYIGDGSNARATGIKNYLESGY